jgi:hypothetical protein
MQGLQWDVIYSGNRKAFFMEREGSAVLIQKPATGPPPKKTKLRGLNPQANYTDRATAACRRSCMN